MGEQKRKVNLKSVKKSKWERTCERCGNDNFVRKPVYICSYCGFQNGVKYVWDC